MERPEDQALRRFSAPSIAHPRKRDHRIGCGFFFFFFFFKKNVIL
jgi:hypothetical protein